MNKLIFPCVLIVLDVGAALVYGFGGDWRHCGYWLSAAALTGFITF